MSITFFSKQLVQNVLNKFGREIKRINSGDISDLVKLLNEQRILHLLDVGANLGQFGKSAFQSGYEGEITSFEPLSDMHSKLIQNASAFPRWQVHPRCALGAKAGEITINRSENAVSSSILEIEDTHTNATEGSRYIGSEKTPVVALDDLQLKNLGETFLKIDTQGFEGEVLKGAADLITKVAGVQVEISIAPLYQDQADYQDVFQVLHSAGLRLWSVEPGFRDPKTRRLLQFDAIFWRNL